MPYLVTEACNQCGACVAGCESQAITEGETQSHIDVTLCTECGTCMRNCPFDAIIFVAEAEAQPAGQPGDRQPRARDEPGRDGSGAA
jgi:ferredoxin